MDKKKKLQIIAWAMVAIAIVVIGFFVPISTYSTPVFYNGATYENCTARKYLFLGVIATAPDGTKYKWSDATSTWTKIYWWI